MISKKEKRLLDLLDQQGNFIVDYKNNLVFEDQFIAVWVYDREFKLYDKFQRKGTFEYDVVKYISDYERSDNHETANQRA